MALKSIAKVTNQKVARATVIGRDRATWRQWAFFLLVLNYEATATLACLAVVSLLSHCCLAGLNNHPTSQLPCWQCSSHSNLSQWSSYVTLLVCCHDRREKLVAPVRRRWGDYLLGMTPIQLGFLDLGWCSAGLLGVNRALLSHSNQSGYVNRLRSSSLANMVCQRRGGGEVVISGYYTNTVWLGPLVSWTSAGVPWLLGHGCWESI